MQLLAIFLLSCASLLFYGGAVLYIGSLFYSLQRQDRRATAFDTFNAVMGLFIGTGFAIGAFSLLFSLA